MEGGRGNKGEGEKGKICIEERGQRGGGEREGRREREREVPSL